MKNLATLAFLLLFTTAAFAQIRPVKKNLELNNNVSNTRLSNNSLATAISAEKKAATDFGLQMVQAYFDNNNSAVSDNFATQLLSMESGSMITVDAQLIQAFANESPLRTDMQLNFSMYNQNYTPEVLNHTEFATKYPNRQQVYKLQAGDFFFNGANLNQGGTELFRASDMVVFVLRPSANGFEIIAL